MSGEATTSTGDAQALVLHAEHAPRPDVPRPGPHETYRHPRLAIEPRPLAPLAAGWIRVEMLYAGVCGTDLHVVQADPETGYVMGSAPLAVGPEGRVLGHEGVARVVEAGAGAAGLEPGRLVTLESILRCHACDPCRHGRLNQCERAELLGMQRDGLFATVADVPAYLAHDVSDLRGDETMLRSAALIEPAACALLALRAARAAAGEHVAVFGAGPIGLFAAMLARHVLGAAAVHVVEPGAFRRALAARHADRASDVEEFFADPPRRPLDVVIEASGDLENVRRVLPLTGAGARIALLARSGRPLALDRVDHLITQNVSILGTRGHLCGPFDDVLRLLRAGRLPLHDAVTDVVDGLPGLAARLAEPQRVVARDCKVVARFAPGLPATVTRPASRESRS